MSMKALEELRNTLCTELDEISKKKEINTQLLDNIDKLTKIGRASCRERVYVLV